MSDPALPPFAQLPVFPELHYDKEGRGWLRDANGKWSAVPQYSQQAPFGDHNPASLLAGPAQPRVQPTSYNFGASVSSGQPSNSTHLPPFDPRFVPLPEDNDNDLSDPSVIAKSRGLKSAHKVAGVRHKSKGKKRRLSSDDSDEESDVPVTKKSRQGRPKGSSNFSKADVNGLLDAVEKLKPMGQKGWQEVEKSFKKWARRNVRPDRDAKSLETKYKILLKTKKPTGDAHCPPEIKRALRIEALIDQCAGARDLSDSEGDGVSSDSSIKELGHSTKTHTAVAQRAPTPALHRHRMNAPELVNKLAQAFDPDALKSRDEERSQRSFQSTQLFTISQQLRDAQATIESLRNQITALQSQTHDIERARDHAEFKLEVLSSDPDMTRRVRVHPSNMRVDGKIRCEEIYPDGGSCTYWITDNSHDDSEKENKAPSSPSSRPRSVHIQSPSPLDLHRSESGSSLIAGPSTVGMQ
ncbi:hypothetical protein DFH07DRAFT_1034059 [Mycena maculata]|uniref:DUF6818 domain-containing protein n=1 Tax=Mycena maculata TaxID=230809 RepID=A0AAD7N8V2_9AGAR|nr:hypothetical protein DFH07DRAFT_1034059 [Mycena maculata]